MECADGVKIVGTMPVSTLAWRLSGHSNLLLQHRRDPFGRRVSEILLPFGGNPLRSHAFKGYDLSIFTTRCHVALHAVILHAPMHAPLRERWRMLTSHDDCVHAQG